jgi:hypothetical protein
MRTGVSAANMLTIAPTGSIQLGGALTTLSYGSTGPMPVTDPLTFPIAISLHGTSTVSINAIGGTVSYDITGSFSSLTGFTASIDVHPNLTVLGFAATCSPMVGTVTGTRLP